jgi:hypothetical protein
MRKRLSVLALLVGCLVTLGVNPPAHQAAPASATSGVWYCVREVWDGVCIVRCCWDDVSCHEYPC